MGRPEFTAWPKTARIFKEPMVITEKIDGTNAAIGFTPGDDGEPVAYAQSRKRLISPGDDNFGFAGWVRENQAALCKRSGSACSTPTGGGGWPIRKQGL